MWAKVGCRLRFERFAPGGFRRLQGEVRSLLLHRANSKMHTTMNKVAAAISAELGGPGVSSWRDLAMGDRMHLVQQHLDLETTAASLIKAAIARCPGGEVWFCWSGL